jgi:hypothetical protein
LRDTHQQRGGCAATDRVVMDFLDRIGPLLMLTIMGLWQLLPFIVILIVVGIFCQALGRRM